MILKRLVSAYKDDRAHRMYLPTERFAQVRDETWRRLFWAGVGFTTVLAVLELVIAVEELASLSSPPQVATVLDLEQMVAVLVWVGLIAGMARLLLLARRTREWVYLWGLFGFVGSFPYCAGALMDAAL
jgi:hypothetical protein